MNGCEAYARQYWYLMWFSQPKYSFVIITAYYSVYYCIGKNLKGKPEIENNTLWLRCNFYFEKYQFEMYFRLTYVFYIPYYPIADWSVAGKWLKWKQIHCKQIFIGTKLEQNWNRTLDGSFWK